MFGLGALSFVAPVALLGLIALPIVWWLLRVIPPAPRRVPFPAIRLIMKLVNPEESSAKTPWWLTLLRLSLITVAILAAAHPVLNAGNQLEGDGPMVLVVDDGWASAKTWNKRRTAFNNLLNQAERQNRSVAVITTAPGSAAQARAMNSLLSADAAREVVQAIQPKPWGVDRMASHAVLNDIAVSGKADIFWLSDGIDHGSARAFADALTKKGSVAVFADGGTDLAKLLQPPVSNQAGLTLKATRAEAGGTETLTVRARGQDGGVLARKALTFAAGEKEASLELELPGEIRNRITLIELEGEASAGGVVLVDERWRRRPVGLVTSADPKGDRPLLDEMHYLDRALEPFTEIRRGSVEELLKRELALLILADPGKMSRADRNRLTKWMGDGGVVLRFAGPRLANNTDPMLPVRLRKGDRELGGALSWSKPARLAAFGEKSPFAGLTIPNDVRINRQVLAQPSVDLPEKTWAQLTDGTPLVTAEKQGAGWLVFVHTTANPTWSNLPLSGLFVGMLQNLVQLSRGVAGESDERLLKPVQNIDGFGRLGSPRDGALGLKATEFASRKPDPRHPPGFYGDGTARRAFNLSPSATSYLALGELGQSVSREAYQEAKETDLRAWVLTAAMLLLLADIIASLALRGFFVMAKVAPQVLVIALLLPAVAMAQSVPQRGPAPFNDDRDFAATLKVRVAYVRTGDRQIDETSHAGLIGLAYIANSRTAAELGDPVAIDPGTDELSYFPLIYWPITEQAEVIPVDTAAKINRYLKSGGTILFDTRDSGGSNFGADRLEEIARNLDVPPMRAVPSDHVLTKAYYLLREFPGRWTGSRVWVERDGSRINDGVSSVIVGGHDWAAAWALDDARKPLYPVVPGGERQREMSYRFGINLLMYVLTGNYKADQVHVPAIMERLGQ